MNLGLVGIKTLNYIEKENEPRNQKPAREEDESDEEELMIGNLQRESPILRV